MSLLGPAGLRETAELCLHKARYAAEQISHSDRFQIAWNHPSFKEFVVRDTKGDVVSLLDEAANQGYLAGIPLGTWYPELADCFLVAVTEKRTREEIDGWAKCLDGAQVKSPVAV